MLDEMNKRKEENRVIVRERTYETKNNERHKEKQQRLEKEQRKEMR